MSLEKIIYKNNIDLSKEIDRHKVPEHIAIIMDGNGRWATKKGLPRSFGHKKGVKSPINFIFDDSSCISSISFCKTSLKRFIRKSTSFVGLVQFSVENA